MNASRTMFQDLLLGRGNRLADQLAQPASRAAHRAVAVILLGCGLYGVSIGWWRSPLMGIYVGIKLPAIIFLTLLVNGILNGMLAILSGSGLTFRQTADCLLLSFAGFALVVGSLAPLSFFVTWNAPPPVSHEAAHFHQSLLLGHTFVIALAGIAATRRLLGLLLVWCPDRTSATRTLTGWLAGNLFAGAQISFLFRPVFGTPHLPVVFFRPDAFHGSFYESIWWALNRGH